MGLFSMKKKHKTAIYAPADGKLLPIEQVPDPVFSQKMMGEGIAIQCCGAVIKAPADGTITMIADTKHAFGMTLPNGCELLVHIGLETVNLKGQGFEVLVETNAMITKGTPILKVDIDFMKEHQMNLCTPMVILNHSEHPITYCETEKQVIAGESLLLEVA